MAGGAEGVFGPEDEHTLFEELKNFPGISREDTPLSANSEYNVDRSVWDEKGALAPEKKE